MAALILVIGIRAQLILIKLFGMGNCSFFTQNCQMYSVCGRNLCLFLFHLFSSELGTFFLVRSPLTFSHGLLSLKRLFSEFPGLLIAQLLLKKNSGSLLLSSLKLTPRNFKNIKIMCKMNQKQASFREKFKATTASLLIFFFQICQKLCIFMYFWYPTFP